ncbi:hypothetical protein F2P44_26665 [Massilia sp. CCM 8695]|uniref:Uncharacterized protein n=1 Tax=Massilia frigida TaxID=2609281 RepID=A0ABX0NHI8_9BURK|nr:MULTISPECIES: hypothetical protein [Massilia]MDM5176947.1 hypothetical protein [Massilia sp. DJPM01]NHZ82829.1 hypothetical protein [Massilia frigida]
MKLRINHLAKTMALCGALLGATTTVYAANPHFVGRVTSTLVGTSVQTCFKIAGLGDNATITVNASANATATFVCQTKNGNCPSAANKTTVNTAVSTSGNFVSDRNGNVSGCLTLNAPGPGNFTCPPGQNLVLANVTFSNITVQSGPTGSATANPPVQSADFRACTRR